MVSSKLAKRFDLLSFAYAHRGLWRSDGPAENSLAAFKVAANAGLGIEIDVRPSVDGVPVCFHDLSLIRMTAHEGFVSDYTSDALQSFKLKGGGHIPSLADLLVIWPTNLPILVELKIDGETDPVAFTKTVADQVSAFGGCAAMMSFSEEAVATIPNDIMQGQLITPRKDTPDFDERLARARASHVDYLALHVTDAAASAGESKPVVCWTVQTAEHRTIVADSGHAEIFDHLPSPLAAH